MNQPEKSLAFVMANKGYDVWLGNQRGTAPSRRHVSLDPDGTKEERAQFFNYSMTEMGKYDDKAFIDYVKKITGVRSLTWVGHSMGTC